MKEFNVKFAEEISDCDLSTKISRAFLQAIHDALDDTEFERLCSKITVRATDYVIGEDIGY